MSVSDNSSLKQNAISCPGHTRPVVDVQFSDLTDHGYYLITASKDGKPMLRRGHTGDWIGTFEGHKGAVWCCTLTPDANRAATGAADFSAKVWNCETGDELLTINHDHIVRAVDFSLSGGERLLTSTNKKVLRVYDLNAPTEATNNISGHSGIIKRAYWIDENRRIMTISEDKTMRVWDLASNEEVSNIKFDDSAHDFHLNRFALSQKSKGILSCGKKVSIWSVDGPKIEKQSEFELSSDIYSACLHPKAFSQCEEENSDISNVFVCGGEDFVIYKCSTSTGTELEASRGHFGPVHCVRFSPDGKLFASGSEDGTVRLWQTIVGETYGLWKLLLPGEEKE